MPGYMMDEGYGRLDRAPSPSPLSSPRRQALPSLTLKPLARSVSNPIISSNKRGGPLVPKPPLRKGKWTPEEEVYAHFIIDNFNKGLINLTRGTTLRSYLSERLNCDPMRVTKKFSGTSCIGKSVFCPCEPTPDNLEMIKVVAHRLEELEGNFKDKIEHNISSAASNGAVASSPLAGGSGNGGRGGYMNRNHWLPPPPPGALPPTSPLHHPHPPPPGRAQPFDPPAFLPPPPPGMKLQHTHTHTNTHLRSPPRSMFSSPSLSYGLPSRHSAPDLALVDDDDAIEGTPSSRRQYTRGRHLGPQHTHTHTHNKRGRTHTYTHDVGVGDFPHLTDHAAGDLLVNFFASVHKNYSHIDEEEDTHRQTYTHAHAQRNKEEEEEEEERMMMMEEGEEGEEGSCGGSDGDEEEIDDEDLKLEPGAPQLVPRGHTHTHTHTPRVVEEDEEAKSFSTSSSAASFSDQETAGAGPCSPSTSSLATPSSPFSPSILSAGVSAMAVGGGGGGDTHTHTQTEAAVPLAVAAAKAAAAAAVGVGVSGCELDEIKSASIKQGEGGDLVATAMKRQKDIDGC